MIGKHKPVEERFWINVVKTETCWLWIGRKNWRGYGEISIKNQFKKAHRFAYEFFIGPIPEGLEIDHLCRVRDCVNPEHLEAVTHRENVMRGNSPSANAASKTHCPQGHPYDEANTLIGRNGWRYCRECRRNRKRS